MKRLAGIIKIVLLALGLYLAADLLLRLFRRLVPVRVPPVMNRLLDTPVREWSQPRRTTLERAGVQPGLSVLELGSGPGFFTVEAARMLEPGGRLVAVDREPGMVALVEEKAREAGLANVEARVADAVRLPFPSGTFDLVLLIAVAGELADKGRALREVRRVLRPDGRLSITETVSDATYALMGEVVGWAQAVGFELVEQHGNALLYTLNFRSLFGP